MARAVYFLFFISGFLGLVYEALWSRYLKLFLGHSSYGQIVTLVTFMGGIGLGSFLIARWIKDIKKPFRLYAIIETLVAVCGVLFHSGYEALTAFFFENAGWLASTPWVGKVVQVSLCLVLTLPFATLLGMTYPLVATGLMRQSGDEGRRSLPILYFVNSLGGAAGILVTSYFFIKHFGTNGTLLVAALGNGFIAVCFGIISLRTEEGETKNAPDEDAAVELPNFEVEPMPKPARDSTVKLWLAVAMGTGFASFIYEVGWIRLLSQLLGSSTHSFDVMISAFIFGLAFGGLFARRLIRKYGKNLAFAMAFVQITMGVLAASTVYVSQPFFDAVLASHSWFMKTEAAYPFYSVFKYLLSLGLMFPASFFAGMTLPLITYYLVQRTGSERFTGSVYGWNTIGSIAGACLAGLVLLPLLQLKWLIVMGGVLDIGLGLALLHYAKSNSQALVSLKLTRLAYAVVICALVPSVWTQFDSKLLSMGLYRKAFNTDAVEVVEIHHGRTATISVVKDQKYTWLSTNGKSDSAIPHLVGDRIPSSIGDEATVAQLASLPMFTRSADKKYDAAIIGMGTGMTLHYLLADQRLQKVDLIEIEESVIDLAQNFRPRNERAYTDPRVNFVVDDAKSYFYSASTQYDLIISEPSNPWVSGVSGLFTTEFYHHIRQFLKPGGTLVQWVHGYEFSNDLMISILNALNTFEQFEVYNVHNNSGDYLILASDSALDLQVADVIRAHTTLEQEFARFGWDIDDLGPKNFLVSSQTLAPILRANNGLENTDHFPHVENYSELAFYRNDSVTLFNIFKSMPSGYQALFNPERHASAMAGLRTDAPPETTHFDYTVLNALLSQPQEDYDWTKIEFMLLDATWKHAGTGHWANLAPVRLFSEATESGIVPEPVAHRFQLMSAVAREDRKAISEQVKNVLETSQDNFIAHSVFRRILVVNTVKYGTTSLLKKLASRINLEQGVPKEEQILIGELLKLIPMGGAPDKNEFAGQ